MKKWIYKLDNYSVNLTKDEQGFCIQRHFKCKYKKNGKKIKTDKKIYIIFHDPYEGGEASDEDWICVDKEHYYNVPNDNEWYSREDAYKWIIDNYGDITEI